MAPYTKILIKKLKDKRKKVDEQKIVQMKLFHLSKRVNLIFYIIINGAEQFKNLGSCISTITQSCTFQLFLVLMIKDNAYNIIYNNFIFAIIGPVKESSKKFLNHNPVCSLLGLLSFG